MDNERRRILRMMAEGKISVEECEELLQALNNRRKDKTEQEIQAVREKRPVWPYVLLVVLAIVALPISLASFSIGFSGLRIPGVFPLFFPAFIGPIRILLFILWIWMIVDCLSRLPCDFRLLFTTQHKYEKWIWLAIVILAGWLGSIVYFFIIRQPAKQIAPPSPQQETKPSQPEQPFRPKRRARSIKPLVIITIIFAIIIPVLALLLFHFIGHRSTRMLFWDYHGLVGGKSAIGLLSIIPAAIIVVLWSIFWLWMLIDCLARDYREFGTLISSDKSADKLLWILLILLLPLIGAIAYHISVRRRPQSVGDAA